MPFHNSKIGLGCVYLNRANHSIIDSAIELGVNFFDTADCYRLAHESEFALGEKLGKYPRKSFILSTKVGVQFSPKGIVLCGSPDYIESSCDASLKRLQT